LPLSWCPAANSPQPLPIRRGGRPLSPGFLPLLGRCFCLVPPAIIEDAFLSADQPLLFGYKRGFNPMIQHNWHCWLLMLFAGLVLRVTALHAAIVPAGDVQPTVVGPSNSIVIVGKTSVGTLLVDSGSILSSNSGGLGNDTGATGTVTITDVGSEWIVNDNFYVGSHGKGFLVIELGAKVTSKSFGYLGYWEGSMGSVTVRGAGSQWNNSREIYVGQGGQGDLVIEDGGEVSSWRGFVGGSNSPNSVTVTGAGSKWTSDAALRIGTRGSGILNITSGGLVKSETLTIDSDLDGDSFLNMASGGMLALKGEADDSLSQFLDLVGWTDAIRYWDASLSDWAPLTSAIFVTDYTLSYLTEGDLTGYTLLTVGQVGDFDGNGIVDGRDLLAWQRNPHLGSLADWQNQYGNGSLSAVAIPEPATWLLILGVIITAYNYRFSATSLPR
jgi:T5SS/PEP-CTERM-associated repeat protein